ncbi:MAG: anti-sigma factor antagonist [Erysipelotrichaceae bacterium]|nr:anti-sigma factor antagonist [Erysipelotrichaceae bacterium]
MRYENENGILTIHLEGAFDTENAEAVGAEIQKIRDEHPDGSLVIDADDLRYISSAGLRQILRLKKKEKDLKIINCSAEVYDIFSMTGFTEMMDIEKGYRRLSVEGCEMIGEGSNGIVYRINPDTIVKVYKNSDALDDIKRERELAKTALVMGINTAIPFDVVRVGDKIGSVFELLNAKSITKLILEDRKNIDKYVKIFADMLKEIHGTPVSSDLIPDAKKTALEWAEWLKEKIPAKTYKKLHQMIKEIPEHRFMLHGDYHTNNVHYDGVEPILIDMDTLAWGHPIFEFASIYLAYQGFGELDKREIEDFLKIDCDLAKEIMDKLFRFYFEDKDEAFIESVISKARVISYTRILRRTLKRRPDEQELIDHYMKQLIEYVDKNDSLVY